MFFILSKFLRTGAASIVSTATQILKHSYTAPSYPYQVIVPLEAYTDGVFTPGHRLGYIRYTEVSLRKTGQTGCYERKAKSNLATQFNRLLSCPHHIPQHLCPAPTAQGMAYSAKRLNSSTVKRCALSKLVIFHRKFSSRALQLKKPLLQLVIFSHSSIHNCSSLHLSVTKV